MEAAQIIRDAVESVKHLHRIQESNPDLAACVKGIKAFQARRFAGTYADLLCSGNYKEVAHFFFAELYSEKDYTERDAQFGRIAGALQKLFPRQVVSTAVSLAQLHVLTEKLDHAMALACMETPGLGAVDSHLYTTAWRIVGQRSERQRQLQVVQEIGRELARLTRMPGLRVMLKMMRKPAQAAGLAALQEFLECGFDTFSRLSRQTQGVEIFLSIIEKRESALFTLLFDGNSGACERELAHITEKEG